MFELSDDGWLEPRSEGRRKQKELDDSGVDELLKNSDDFEERLANDLEGFVGQR